MNSYEDAIREFFAVRFTEILDKWKRDTPGRKRTDKEFAAAVNAITKDGKCTDRTVSKWRQGHDVPTKYMDAICDVLGVTPSVFFPRSHSEKYRWDRETNEQLAEGLAQFCDSIGLSQDFLAWITTMDDFAEQFPWYSPLVRQEPLPILGKTKYVRMVHGDALNIDSSFHIQKGGKTIVLHPIDLRFLKEEIQDRLMDRAAAYFNDRKKTMKDEDKKANDMICRETKDGWTREGWLSVEDMLEIDPYFKYVIHAKEDDDNGET